MFGIGTYRQRLYLQQENPVADTGGGNQMAWTTIGVVWASVEPLNGNEYVQAGKLSSAATHRIKMRYDSTIAASMRFLWGSRVLNIRSVRNLQERSRAIEILAQEGVAT